MKQLFLGILSLVLVCACVDSHKSDKKGGVVADTIAQNADTTGDSALFREEVRLKTTPVKRQGHSGLCWAYAMLATIETEHLMQGDSVNLSVDFVARHFLKEQTMAFRRGNDISTRGIAPMLIRLIQVYGLTHYDAYHLRGDDDEHRLNYNVLCNKLEHLARFNQRSLSTLEKKAEELLDEKIGPVPRYVFMLGAEYTALEFAHSVCRKDEYESITSFTHHPFNQYFPLEVADNYYRDTYLNLPLDTMMMRIDNALRQGHPVCWEGDISEPLFSFAKGMAMLQDEHQPVTQKYRQQSFELGKTTDDHCMEIVGIAWKRESRGAADGSPRQKYYIMKNSWGDGNPYGGFMYVSENYVRLKTIGIVLPRLNDEDDKH